VGNPDMAILPSQVPVPSPVVAGLYLLSTTFVKGRRKIRVFAHTGSNTKFTYINYQEPIFGST